MVKTKGVERFVMDTLKKPRPDFCLGMLSLSLSLPLLVAPLVMAQSQDEMINLQVKVIEAGKSPEDVNRAMRDQFLNSRFPYYEPPNGCSTPGGISVGWGNNELFRAACNNHDICYSTPGKSQSYCDKKFLSDMFEICGDRWQCKARARDYHSGVVLGGKDAYDTAQKQQREYIESVYAWLSGIAGVWESTEGTITFKQSGSNISATYTQDNGAIEGSISNNILTGYWIEDGSARRCSASRNGSYHWGKIRFVFEGSAFRGSWGYCDDEPGNSWTGNRRSS